MAAPSAEVQFAQRLAGNEKKTRDKALKKLKKFIRSRSSTKTGLSEDDLIKLWKGLHYCMWMQDKPLLQEELAIHISRLLFSFPNIESSMQFFKVFLMTEAREWNGIDRLRMDKFMVLVRQMVNQIFVLLKQECWKEDGIEHFVAILNSTLLNTTVDTIPDSLNMHIADVFIPELTKVGSEQLNGQTILSFLKVFDTYLQVSKRPLVLKRILNSVYNTVIQQAALRVQQIAKREAEREAGEKDEENTEDSDSGYDEDSEPRLKFDCEMIADHLFKIGSSDACCSTNRQKLYNTVKCLRDVVTVSSVEVEEEYDPDADLEDAVMRLDKINTVRKRKKKKLEDTEDDGVETADVAEPPKGKKRKKKRKRKSKEDQEHHTKGESSAKKTKLSDESDKKTVIPESDTPKKKRRKKKKKSKRPQSPDATKGESINKGDNSVKVSSEETLKTGSVSGSNSNSEKEKVEMLTMHTHEAVADDLAKKKLKKKKKKRQQCEETVELEDMTPSKKMKTESLHKPSKLTKQLFEGKSDQKSKENATTTKKDISTDKLEFDKPMQEGEVEIWVPNRKYQKKRKVKGEGHVSDEKEVKVDKEKAKVNKRKAKVDKEKVNVAINVKVNKNVKVDKEVRDKKTDRKEKQEMKTKLEVKEKVKAKKKKSKASAFAEFQKLSSPPAAFVKKSIAKATKTPSKTDGCVMTTPQLTASEKKVKFNMKKNTAQKFEDSINISPMPAFVPTKNPVQGILKSPVSVTPKKSGKKKKKKLRNQSHPDHTDQTPSFRRKSMTRSMAADFF